MQVFVLLAWRALDVLLACSYGSAALAFKTPLAPGGLQHLKENMKKSVQVRVGPRGARLARGIKIENTKIFHVFDTP